MRELLEQPLELDKAEGINKTAFHRLFRDNLEKILYVDKRAPEGAIKAAKDNIALCRAAIGCFAGRRSLQAVREVIDCYRPWSPMIVRTARAADPRRPKGTPAPETYNILYLPEGDEQNVQRMLRKITTSARLMENVKASWEEFRLGCGLKNEVIISGGGMGCELIERGLIADPAAWNNKEHGDVVREIHEGHVRSGAQVVLTNTLDANSAKLKKYNKRKYVEKLNRLGVQIARDACAGEDILVFGRIGPSGYDDELACSGRNGNGLQQDLGDAFAEQAAVLCDARVDGIWIGGMCYLPEAVIAVEATSKTADVPVICTMQFQLADSPGRGDFITLWGNGVSDVVCTLEQAGAKAVGASCGAIVGDMPPLAWQMGEMTKLPLVFEMNAGVPYLVPKEKQCEAKYGMLGPAEFADIMWQLAVQGASIIGGCCGVRPEHISAVRERLKKWKQYNEDQDFSGDYAPSVPD